MAELCTICGNKLGLIFNKVKLKDGLICGSCVQKAKGISSLDCRTIEEVKERYTYLEEKNELFNSFNPTSKVQGYIQIDENKKLFKLGKSEECFDFSELVNFELNEDGESVTSGGLGRAVAGGVLFGGIGAVVGGVTGGKKSKSTVNSMYIRISINNKWIKQERIDLIKTETKKNGIVYKSSKATADQIISLLETVVNQNEINSINENTQNQQIQSSADEILKFKQLMDAGIITQEEFEIKKKQLLGI